MIELLSLPPALSNAACLADSAAIFMALLARTPTNPGLEPPPPYPEISARVARTDGDLAEAGALVSRRYAGRGFEVDRSCESGALDPDRYLTLLARDSDRTLGTLTLGVDAGAGLLADEMNGTVLDEFRREGRRLSEIVRLAVDEGVDTKPVLSSLFNLAYLMGRGLHEVTDVFVEVNPRHVPFYSRVMGFVRAAAQSICPRVNAPSVLLRLDVSTLDRKLLVLNRQSVPSLA